MYPNFYKHTLPLIGLVVIGSFVVADVVGNHPEESVAQIANEKAIQARIVEMHSKAVPVILKEQKVYTQKDRLSPKDLKSLLYDVGFRGSALREAWGTAMKESTGRPMAHNKNSKTGDNSYGLFQINMIGSLGPARMEQYGLSSYEDLFDPRTNAKIAFKMSNGGKNWSAWHGITERTQEWMKEFPN